jgi:galactoside O-acetyltransferase
VSEPLGPDELRRLGIGSVGEDVRVDPTARLLGISRLHIGSHVRIDAFCVLSAGAGGIHVGDHVHIAAFVFMAGGARIEIHDFAGVSGRASLYSSNDDYTGATLTGPTVPDELRDVAEAPVTIGRHAVVGAGSIVLPGVTVGEGSASGALSLVKRDVEPFTIVGGVPARPIGTRSRGVLDLERRLR